MPYLIGADEAGYGPNFGPLVVAATLWHVEEPCDGSELYARLRRVVAPSLDQCGKQKIVWADSKAVYKNGNGHDRLEQGALTGLGLTGEIPTAWCELWPRLDPICAPGMKKLPWHVGYDARLPLWCDSAKLAASTDRVAAEMARCGVRLVAVLSRVVFPGEFNGLVAELSSKSEALSKVTVGLVADVLNLVEDGPVCVYCDKHGARNRYLPVLQRQFPDDWIEAWFESGLTSRYRFGPEERRVEIGFWVGGERFLPTALASMAAKYLREAAMLPFNEFWCSRVPGLTPTAGYPSDSHRFRRQIAALQRELGIDDHVLWRCR